ncbi:hypothetical protein MAPG_11149 [Magnaporthiopsis poae ATCC 64411]|uniref:Uncharacterized protein n=1 Tax=Magnaporthiopsis poae (strain ATCC 64411 / 73-15) TaxID=644358 RepID=A0A0C4EEH6_MAGP6|nr:hypothetical protein MAPG_11149 [Magnaporthiopsis poae ATCC 64411]
MTLPASVSARPRLPPHSGSKTGTTCLSRRQVSCCHRKMLVNCPRDKGDLDCGVERTQGSHHSVGPQVLRDLMHDDVDAVVSQNDHMKHIDQAQQRKI